jgi:transposase
MQLRLAASAEGRYLHRLHCALLVAEGRSCCEVARWFGDDQRTVERWVHAIADRGVDGLRERHSGGRRARLSAEQIQRLAPELRSAPRLAGYPHSNWSGKLLMRHLEARYAIAPSARRCQRLLRRIGA